MQLYFIRHGESYNNALWRTEGNNNQRNEDPELTEKGVLQFNSLADYIDKADRCKSNLAFDYYNLNGFHLTHIYTSLMVRAIKSGAVLAEKLNLPLIGWIDIHESGGIYQIEKVTGERKGLPGKNRDELSMLFPTLILPEEMKANGWWDRNYEGVEDRQLRSRKVLRDLLSRHGDTDDKVAFISHAGFFNVFIAAVLELPEEHHLLFSVSNSSISRIDFEEDTTQIVYLNRLDHLAGELRK